MIIQLGKRLKALRKNKDMTQDELAECLGVSYQAVSRWERGEGYPDIEMLPLIAAFFDTTTDDLLGVNQEKSRRKIKEYLAQGSEYFNKQEYSNCVNVLREALSEFPNADEITAALMCALYSDHTNAVAAGNAKGNSDEIISLGKRVLSCSTNDTLRAKMKDTLCCHYLYNLKDVEKAKEIADTIPLFDYDRMFIPPLFIDDMSERQKSYQQMIMDHAHVVAGSIRCYIGSDEKLTVDTKIRLYQRCNKMYEALFDDEYDFDMLLSNQLALAKLHMELGEHENAMNALTRCGELAECFDRVKTLSYMATYKTPLLNRLPIRIEATTAFEKRETHDISLRAILLTELDNNKEIFSQLRDCEDYQKLISVIN